MPYARRTLAQLRADVASDIAAALPGSDSLLRFSNLGIMGDCQAGFANQHYGYLDWISLQAVPFTSTDEYLEAWGAMKGVYRKDATAASGTVVFQGTYNATTPITLPQGTGLVRGDGEAYTVTQDAHQATDGTVTVSALDNATGAQGNCVAGVGFALAIPVNGLMANGSASTAFTGGADVEDNDTYRQRILDAYQQPPAGGNENDYENWALAVPGVTRAWCTPNGMGTGTVVVYVMLDEANASNGGFPQGSNGCATNETRGITATGDQLTVANAIYPVQPVTALVYACAPGQQLVNFTITGLKNASSTTLAAVDAAIDDVFFREGQPGGTIDLSEINSAIAAVSGTAGFVITVPTANIVCGTGALPVTGTITYA
jgi:uncharacterized phage protein gp47/JayE